MQVCTCTPNAHLYRVAYTRCRIYTINSPDDGHMAARNIQRIEINIHEKELCVKLVIYKDYGEMRGQQNIKVLNISLTDITVGINQEKIFVHHHYISVMEMGHLLTRSGLT